MRVPTISQLEERLSPIQIREARRRTIEKLDGQLAISKGLKYIAKVLEIYEECLKDEYDLSRLKGDFVRKDDYII